MNLRQVLPLRRGSAPAAAAPPAGGRSDVVRSMPRREISHSIGEAHVVLPRARRVRFDSGIIRPIGRLFVWLWCLAQFYFGNLGDFLRGRASLERRAIRLRRVFEGGGPTFAKLGQQLSMRADMLPYAYCVELGKMLDRAPAFPTSEAIAITERSLGKPLAEVFASFDPEPIGSASLACVYQAQLRSGERVAVKVRRPGIGPLIAADLRAMDWLLLLLETLTFVQPGLTRNLRRDVETILFNELNFRAEARYTDLFRERAAKRKKGVTAPRVYFAYCTEEVMVSELVSGVWMWELMAAVDTGDREFLSRVRRSGIEPKSLARKLVRIMQHEVQEELFFHADPHPANIVVMPNNGLCFIDFGAIGRFSTQTRKAIFEFQHHMITGDATRMVSCILSLLGPLPPVDVEKIRAEMEKVYSESLYAMNSRDAEWWERSVTQGWLRLQEILRQYSMPPRLETLQLFRTTFAYDGIVHRLNKDLNVAKEWQASIRESAKQARKRVHKSLKQRLRGPTDADYLQMEEFGDMLGQSFFQLQRNIENPIIHFRNIVGKIAYIASLFLKLGSLVGVAVAIGLIADRISKHWLGREIDWAAMLERATAIGWTHLAGIVVLLVIIRRIVIRLNLPDTRLGPGR